MNIDTVNARQIYNESMQAAARPDYDENKSERELLEMDEHGFISHIARFAVDMLNSGEPDEKIIKATGISDRALYKIKNRVAEHMACLRRDAAAKNAGTDPDSEIDPEIKTESDIQEDAQEDPDIGTDVNIDIDADCEPEDADTEYISSNTESDETASDVGSESEYIPVTDVPTESEDIKSDISSNTDAITGYDAAVSDTLGYVKHRFSMAEEEYKKVANELSEIDREFEALSKKRNDLFEKRNKLMSEIEGFHKFMTEFKAILIKNGRNTD